MDDLKLYAINTNELDGMIELTHGYATDIGMAFGANKCATYHLTRGRESTVADDTRLVDGTVIQKLAPGGSYTYLGIEQRRMHEVANVKASLTSKHV